MLKMNKFKLITIIILLLICIDLYASSPSGSGNTIDIKTDKNNSVKTGHPDKVIEKTIVYKDNKSIIGLTERIESLEKDNISIDCERALWSEEIASQRFLYSTIVSVIIAILGFGFGSFMGIKLYRSEKKIKEMVSEDLNNMEYQVKANLEESTKKIVKNESLLYRSFYITNITAEQYLSALLWCTRIILIEKEKKAHDCMNENFIDNYLTKSRQIVDELVTAQIVKEADMLKDLLSNFTDISKEMTGILTVEQVKSLTYVIDHLQKKIKQSFKNK